LIFDLPKQTPQLWLKDLQTALQFCPDHFSCYTLTWAESAPLGQILTEENFPSSASSDHSLLDLTHRELETKGYPAYEVCSFSPSKEKHSRHNQLYWNYSPYLGLGPSAASFQIIDDQYVRWTSEPQLSSSPQIPQIEKEILTYENRLLEQLFLGLRTTAGISLDSLYSLFPNDFSLHAFPLLSDLQKNGTFCVTSSHLTPTRKGIFLADGLAMDFFQLLSPFLKN
jgi:oxygen-independent coproporphyrinogen-3 oxidase